MRRTFAVLSFGIVAFATSLPAAAPLTLSGTEPLSGTGDVSAAMVAGLHRRLETLTREVVTERSAL